MPAGSISSGAPSARDWPVPSLPEHEHTLGDDGDYLQFVGSRDDGLTRLAQIADEASTENPLGARVEGGGRLIAGGIRWGVESTDAMAARFFSPPDNSKGARLARLVISICSRASSTRSFTSAERGQAATGRKLHHRTL